MKNICIHQVAFSLFICMVTVKVKAGTGLYTGPYFPSPQSRNLTIHQNTVAYLPCTVKQLGDKSVSWVRQRDADILTVDRYTFVRDDRLTVHFIPDTETWTLVIKYVQARDAGTYECQVSTEPKMSLLLHLNVIVPQVEVVGAVDKYVRKGSTAQLGCTVSSTVQLPDYIFWYHSGQRLLEYDHPRIRINVTKRGGQGSEMSITSSLVITDAMVSDDGNYTCLPSNLHNATTILHVLNDEHPAAMQTAAAMLTDPPSPFGILLVVLLAFILVHSHQDCHDSRRRRPRVQLESPESIQKDILTLKQCEDLRMKPDDTAIKGFQGGSYVSLIGWRVLELESSQRHWAYTALLSSKGVRIKSLKGTFTFYFCLNVASGRLCSHEVISTKISNLTTTQKDQRTEEAGDPRQVDDFNISRSFNIQQSVTKSFCRYPMRRIMCCTIKMY